MRKLLILTIAVAVAAIGCSKKGGSGNNDPYAGYYGGVNNCPGINGPLPAPYQNGAGYPVAGQPGYRPGYPPPVQPGYPPVAGQPGYRPGYPPPVQPGYPVAGQPGYRPGYPPVYQNNVGWGSAGYGYPPACNYNAVNGAYNFNYYFTGICQQLTMYNPGKVYIEMQVPGGMVSCIEYAAYQSYLPPNYYGNVNPAVPVNGCISGNCGCSSGASISFGVFPFGGFNYSTCTD